MTALVCDSALLTGFHSLKGDRWGVVLQVEKLPDRVTLALAKLHRSEPVLLTLVPRDANDLFLHTNGECEKDKMTESRRNKLAIQRLWISSGCPGTLDEFYSQESAKWRASLDDSARSTEGKL